MSNPTTLQAAADLQKTLEALGLKTKLSPSKNEWMAKLETPNGAICVYTDSRGKVSAKTHEIRGTEQRAAIEKTLAEAENKKTIPSTGCWTIYTDGSAESGQCGWAAVVFDPNGNKERERSGNLGPQTNNQIAGEIEGAIWAIRRALNTGTKEILIRHDYEGVGHWGRGDWKHSDPDAARLKAWCAEAKRKGVEITFEWNKGHAGNPGNERADQLAGEATKLPVSPRIPPPSHPEQAVEMN